MSDPYARIGSVDPNYTSALLPQLQQDLLKGSRFNSYNSAARLTGFFRNVLTSTHAKAEVPAVLLRARSPITTATLSSYLDHLKANGDGILAALGTFRNTDSGGERAAFVNESSLSCGSRAVLATTANYNYGFVHTSARSHVYTAGYHNQQTDFWQGATKFYWLRAEKHFQIQAATASRYVTEVAEDVYAKHYETVDSRVSNLNSWALFTTKADLVIEKNLTASFASADIRAADSLLIASKQAQVAAENNLVLTADGAAYIKGAQIFLVTGGKTPLPPPPIVLDRLDEPIAPAVTLPTYQRSASVPNRKLPTVLTGTQQIGIPPI